MVRPQLISEFSRPVTIAIALFAIAAVVAMIYLLRVSDVIDAGQCRIRYQRADTAADSLLVDAHRATDTNGFQLTCGALRRSGQIR
jgi:hypothetical protein